MSDERAQFLNDFGRDRLPGMLGLEILTCTAERVTGRIPVTPPLIAGTGFLWAPVVIALADTLCAYGTGVWVRPVSEEATAQYEALVTAGQLPHQDTYQLRVGELQRTETVPGMPPR